MSRLVGVNVLRRHTTVDPARAASFLKPAL